MRNVRDDVSGMTIFLSFYRLFHSVLSVSLLRVINLLNTLPVHLGFTVVSEYQRESNNLDGDSHGTLLERRRGVYPSG